MFIYHVHEFQINAQRGVSLYQAENNKCKALNKMHRVEKVITSILHLCRKKHRYMDCIDYQAEILFCIEYFVKIQ